MDLGNSMFTKKESTKNDYKVLITTSGVGSRLGELTKYTNKSLIPIGDKPAISHIIESYPTGVTFVITLGYFGQIVKEFLTLAYPDLKFEFVNVKNFNGPGSSLANSINSARSLLQTPFIYHACDSILIGENLPPPNFNWIAGFHGKDATNYASFNVHEDTVTLFHEKGSLEFDYIHVGVVGVKDFGDFWEALENSLDYDSNDQSLNDVSVVSKLILDHKVFKLVLINNWFDTGNSNSLRITRNFFKSRANILEKPEESIFFIGNSVIKYFSTTEVVRNRVTRSKYLQNITPKVLVSTDHFYMYKYEDGKLASDEVDANLIDTLLGWGIDNLWIPNPNTNHDEFKSKCTEFYVDKSLRRIEEFCNSRAINDDFAQINKISVPPAEDLVLSAEKILANIYKEAGFHGDFILDNILVQSNRFKLIDWRQDFAGSIQYGDMYYDLAKLNHSLHVNHKIVNKELFSIHRDPSDIKCSLLRNDYHIEMEKKLKLFVESNNLSWLKIQILTPLIWLNMSPLHHYPFDLFLYFYGRLNLWRALNEASQ